jgi:hypothetical protein
MCSLEKNKDVEINNTSYFSGFIDLTTDLFLKGLGQEMD